MTKYNIFTTLGLVICIMGLVWLLSSPKFSCIRKNEKIVNTNIYDSLVAITNRPPKIDTLIIHDTISGEPIIKWKDKLIPVYKDSLSAVYSDTLKTNHFKVVTNDTLQYNRIIYRKYSYETYIDTIKIVKEVEKPVFVDKPFLVLKKGFYYGGGSNIYKQGFSLIGEFTYINKKDFYIKVEGGIISNINTKVDYYPTIGFRVGKKF
jgi:hypothetical protein